VPLVKPSTPVWQPRHPLARGCRLFLPFTERAGSPCDLVGKVAGTMGAGATWAVGLSGPEIAGDGSGTASINLGTLGTILDGATPPLSLAVRYTPAATMAQTQFGKWGEATTATRFAAFAMADGSVIGAMSNGLVGPIVQTAVNTLTPSTPADILMIWDTVSTIKVYVNGTERTTSPLASGSPANLTASTASFFLGQPEGTNTIKGRLTFAALWNANMRSQAGVLVADPWAPARPRTRLIVPFGGTGGGETLATPPIHLISPHWRSPYPIVES
jgi:hypothetical protein